jgi:putative integral membrane protein (TIGR02587 family)
MTQSHTGTNDPRQEGERWGFLIEMGRAFAGAVIFAISLFMTMELWWLGFYMDRFRLTLFLVVNMAVLIGLARYRGFKRNISWFGIIVDAFVGYAVGLAAGALYLWLFGVIHIGMSWNESIGKVALAAVPGSIGALLARGQFGNSDEDSDEDPGEAGHYGHELFLMIAGALFVGFTVAPTEEIVLIAYQISAWHALVMVLLSVILMHAFVYTVNFRGQEKAPEKIGFWDLFIRYSVTGYVAVLLTSAYILWSFGRLDGTAFTPALVASIVLSVPGALGAAAARLIL